MQFVPDLQPWWMQWTFSPVIEDKAPRLGALKGRCELWKVVMDTDMKYLALISCCSLFFRFWKKFMIVEFELMSMLSSSVKSRPVPSLPSCSIPSPSRPVPSFGRNCKNWAFVHQEMQDCDSKNLCVHPLCIFLAAPMLFSRGFIVIWGIIW